MLEAITAAERDVAEAEADYNDAKQAATDAKKRYEGKVDRLRDVIKSANEPLLPFSETEETFDKGWRDVAIDDLDLPTQLVEHLGEKQLHTIGDLSDWTSNKQLTDIDGVGPAKAEQIENALTKFWQDNPQYAESEDPEGGESEENEAA